MSKWISVDAALPVEPGSYLICTDRNAVCVAHFYPASDQFSGVAGKHAKYWQPLPEPPKPEGYVVTNYYDKLETIEHCTVQILRNSVTGEISVVGRPEEEE